MALLALELAWSAGDLSGIDYLYLSKRARDFTLYWAWLLPLLATASIFLLTTARARRVMPGRRHRVVVGILLTAAVFSVIGVFGATVSLLTLGLAVGVVLLFAWIFVIPQRIAPPLSEAELDKLNNPRDSLELKDGRTKLQNDIRATALQTLAGLAVIGGALLAFQQLRDDQQQANATRELTLHGQASEQFTRAIDQLGSSRTEVQLGGIYGLEQIAKQDPDNRPAVTEVLVAFLHRRSPRRNTKLPAGKEELRLRAPEVQAALTVLIRRTGEDTNDPVLDMRNLDLRGADLDNPDYTLATNAGTFSNAGLASVDLTGTDFRNAKFRNVYTGLTSFDKVSLCGADLSSMSPTDVDSYTFRGAFADSTTVWPPGLNTKSFELRHPKHPTDCD